MERAAAAPEPIGFTELLSALAAVVFGLLAGGALLGSVTGGHTAPAAPLLVTRALADDTCASAPRDPLAMRLGLTRAYPRPVDITLQAAPFSLEPAIAADDAYRRSGQHLSGCETEELLAFYTSTSPAFTHVLAWVLVSTLACPASGGGADASARQCVSVSPVDATSGALMGTRIFQLPPQ